MEERAVKVQWARYSEQAERYDDMKDAMKSVVQAGEPLSSEERNLLSVAYKNVCGARRSAWRVANTLKRSATSELQRKVADDMRVKIENELEKICDEVLDLIRQCLEHSQDDNELRTFFNKMQGDYYRYRVEVADSNDEIHKTLVQKAKDAYEKAMEAAKELATTHPVRLGLALNFSVFYFEIEDNKTEACQMAKTAFDEAIADIDHVSEDTYKDSTLIMQLLRDNLALWSADDEAEDGTE
ncbi:14-3-3 protein homolog 1-like [Anneissia japonica]|uniref:14-3-3 protein homolog 1-like n=1 Tax=Anneissia japonica TaxID=1529436 RepID=UPI001425841C|nr:14-3-3 protein homolog 1-like [Anneissia japonica]